LVWTKHTHKPSTWILVSSIICTEEKLKKKNLLAIISSHAITWRNDRLNNGRDKRLDAVIKNNNLAT